MTATPATEIPASLAEALLLPCLYNRRSWKPSSMDPDREITDELIGILLDAACQAPTHGLIEPWRFLVFQGAARARLAAQLPAVYDAVTPLDQLRTDKREKLGIIFGQAPVVLVLACHHSPEGKIPLLENQLAVACAVQNLHLAAHAAGLAAMWWSPPVVASDQARLVFDLQPHEHALGVFFLAWPRCGVPSPTSVRRPWTEKSRWYRH